MENVWKGDFFLISHSVPHAVAFSGKCLLAREINLKHSHFDTSFLPLFRKRKLEDDKRTLGNSASLELYPFNTSSAVIIQRFCQNLSVIKAF